MDLHFIIAGMEADRGVAGKKQSAIRTSFSKMEGMTVSSHTLTAGGRGLEL